MYSRKVWEVNYSDIDWIMQEINSFLSNPNRSLINITEWANDHYHYIVVYYYEKTPTNIGP